MRRFTWPLLFALFAASFAFSQTFATIDFPGAAVTSANGINTAGAIVGTYALTTASSARAHGFRLQNNTFTKIEVPGCVSTDVQGISSAADIVGTCVGTDGIGRGFIRHAGAYHTYRYPSSSAKRTVFRSINKACLVVGYWEDTTGKAHGLLFANGKSSAAKLGGKSVIPMGISDSGEIVGYYLTSAGDLRGFDYRGGTLRTIAFPGAAGTVGWGVNTKGQIAGTYALSFVHAFTLKSGTYKQLRFPNSQFTAAFGINYGAVVVGQYKDASGKVHGFAAH